ncbi:hypothetical protein Zmor_011460 [Zophobas morio]|uniref:Reverse transcriptase domain-containing protein n=1 Tax=Zophobas morio TaxID=2755281 RepID=A0AA38IV63_9CUCU|nr:hypothetical protein Zmor_011460 [Zophobas morio]
MMKFLLEHKIIPAEQHGFVPKRSVITNLLSCLNDWSRELDNDNPVDVIYFDYIKAFDKVPTRRLLHKLEHFGIRGGLLKWIEGFLSFRTFRVKIDGCLSNSQKVLSGVPQGTVLGPILFIVYIADLTVELSSPFALFADDLKLYNTSKNNNVLKADLITLYAWTQKWLMPFNMKKCCVLHLGRNNPKMQYNLGGHVLQCVSSQIDLGITITEDLSWSSHILSVVKKANSIGYLIRKAFPCAPIEIIAKLHKTYVRPTLEYANSVWHPILVRDKQLLESVQRRITRIPFGFHRPSYEDRLKMMKLPTIEHRYVRGDVITTFKILSQLDSPIRHLFLTSADSRTRGHRLKLRKYAFKTRMRQFFLPERVLGIWNSLSPNIIESSSLISFKIALDTWFVGHHN